jgi:vancomycin resistance protein YoaR
MSLLKHSKFIALIIVGVFLPLAIGHAKTVSFGTQKWDVTVNLTGATQHEIVRNDFNLLRFAQATISGVSLVDYDQLLTDQTVVSLDQITQSINQPAKSPQLIIENNRATNFDPGQNGQSLDLYTLRTSLLSNTDKIDLPVIISLPHNTLAQTNTLGINELVAVGESNFSGSPKNRIHNITVGAKKFNGLIIQPNEEFSFNKYLGDVDAEHGFLPELVIKPEGVTPEFGGGLCQVSSTTFRAAMNAGLPITARRNHSFAVQYYAPQGTDATIYPWSADLKFINNLKSVMLIRTRIDGRKLYFEFYGTKDDRQISFDGPTQYDKKSDGSMKAIWTRHVTLNGQTTDQVFKSVYLPPALFHHDAVEAPSTPNPEAQVTPPLTSTPPQ